MPPAAPPKFPSPLTTPRIPTPTASEYSPDHGLDSDNVTLKDGSAAPTQTALLKRNAGPQYYITLTITSPEEYVYTTTILLGDDYPGSAPTDPVQQSASSPELTAASHQGSGLSSGSVAGIIIGVFGGLAVLAGVFYLYMLRARQGQSAKKKRKHKKKRKKKKTTWFTFNFKFKKSKKKRRSRRSSTSTGGTGPPPPPPPGPGPPPPPPEDAGPPPPPPPAE